MLLLSRRSLLLLNKSDLVSKEGMFDKFPSGGTTVVAAAAAADIITMKVIRIVRNFFLSIFDNCGRLLSVVEEKYSVNTAVRRWSLRVAAAGSYPFLALRVEAGYGVLTELLR